MTVKEYHEDIFMAPSQTLTVTINTEGAMGRGVALAFRQKVPGLYTEYLRRCNSGQQTADHLWVFPWEAENKQVLCFPTKTHWRWGSPPELIAYNLRKLTRIYRELGITSLAMPPLGCGNGGLSYEYQVRDMMFEYLSDMDIDVRISYGLRDPRV